MLDPISAAAAATSAYNLVKQMVQHGKDAEDVLSTIGKWYGHASDCIYATEKKQNPSIFKRVVFSQSVEAEAVKALAARKRIEKQRAELHSLVGMVFGKQGLLELRQIKQEIIKERQRQVYAREEMRQQIAQVAALLILICIMGALIAFILS
jgi:hypothetical protein